MLHRLGHDAVIRSDHQHGKVNAAGTGEHIFDKLFMSRHVYNTGLGPVWPVQMGKAQFDGDAPLFFFLQTVCIDTGEGFYQQGFSVVHVSCRSDDDMLHAFASRTASTITAKSDSIRVRTSRRYLPSWIRPMMGRRPLRRVSSSLLTSFSKATA